MKYLARTICLLSLLALPLAGNAEVIAFDMVGSGSQNLISHTNPSEDAFGSPADGFQRYQRGVSASIPFAVLDDSLSFASDSLGIIREDNTGVFFGVTDTENGDNSGPVSASWVFDVSGFTNLSLGLDVGAMGDFEDGADVFTWSYSIDGSPMMTAFQNTVDESGAHTYTLASGAMFTLNDPMLLNGTILTNELANFMTSLIGAGDLLTLTLTAETNGGSEAFAFQNLVISGDRIAAPAPATLLLLVWGFGMHLLRRKRTV